MKNRQKVEKENRPTEKKVDLLEAQRSLPVSERMKRISVVSWEKGYYAEWRKVRWFILLLAPVAAGALRRLLAAKYGLGLLGFLLGSGFTLILYFALLRGGVSSNKGTYFRTTEPVRFWLDILFVTAFYLLALYGLWLAD